MAMGFFYVRQRCTFDAEKVHVHTNKGFIHDVKTRFWQQAMDISHAAIGRVLDRQHRFDGIPVAHGLDHVLEGRAGQGLQMRACFAAGLVRIGAGFSLEGDTSCHFSDFLRQGRSVALTTP